MNAIFPTYPILLIYSEEDQAWLARVDQLPGCVVDGATPEQALVNSRKAIETWIEIAGELKRPIPAPLTAEGLESLNTEVAAKQQEALQATMRELVDDVLRQFQSVKLRQSTVNTPTLGMRLPGAPVPDTNRNWAEAI